MGLNSKRDNNIEKQETRLEYKVVFSYALLSMLLVALHLYCCCCFFKRETDQECCVWVFLHCVDIQ